MTLKQHRDSVTDTDTPDIYPELVALNTAAKTTHLGIYTTDEVVKKNAIRAVDWTTDATKYFETLQLGRKVALSPTTPIVLDVVIEHIRDGASFRCYVPKDSCYVSFAFAGATCPRVNTPSASAGTVSADGSTPSAAAGPEPFAVQSKLFTELRLLNRRLELVRVV